MNRRPFVAFTDIKITFFCPITVGPIKHRYESAIEGTTGFSLCDSRARLSRIIM
jgi:hypothetical protein